MKISEYPGVVSAMSQLTIQVELAQYRECLKELYVEREGLDQEIQTVIAMIKQCEAKVEMTVVAPSVPYATIGLPSADALPNEDESFDLPQIWRPLAEPELVVASFTVTKKEPEESYAGSLCVPVYREDKPQPIVWEEGDPIDPNYDYRNDPENRDPEDNVWLNTPNTPEENALIREQQDLTGVNWDDVVPDDEDTEPTNDELSDGSLEDLLNNLDESEESVEESEVFSLADMAIGETKLFETTPKVIPEKAKAKIARPIFEVRPPRMDIIQYFARKKYPMTILLEGELRILGPVGDGEVCEIVFAPGQALDACDTAQLLAAQAGAQGLSGLVVLTVQTEHGISEAWVAHFPE